MIEASADERHALTEAASGSRALTVAAGQRRPVVLLLGMPCSGTLLCSQILGMLGIDIAEDAPAALATSGALPPAQPIGQLHERILALFHRAYATPLHDFQLPTAWWADPRVRALQREIAARVKERMADGLPVGFADPRTARLLPVWHQIFRQLAIDPKIVLCLRNPAEVAHALHAGDGLAPDIGEFRWLNYMADTFRNLRNYETCTIEYEDWFREPGGNLEKLIRFLGIEWDQSEADLRVALAEILDAGLGPDGPTEREARQPLVRSFYKLARRFDEDAEARRHIGYIVTQFVTFRQLHRPFEREFEELTAAAAGWLRLVPAPPETPSALLAEAERRAEAADARQQMALRQRADADAALARAQQAGEVQRAAAAAELASLRRDLALRDALLAEARAERDAALARADAAAAEHAAARKLVVEREGELSDTAGRAKDMADRVQAVLATLAEAAAARRHAEELAAERLTAIAAREAQIDALQGALDAARAEARLAAEARAADHTATAVTLVQAAAELADWGIAGAAVAIEVAGLRAAAAASAAAQDRAAAKAAERNAAARAGLTALRSQLAARNGALIEARDREAALAARLAAAEAARADAERRAEEQEAVTAAGLAVMQAAFGEQDAVFARMKRQAELDERSAAERNAAVAAARADLVALQAELALCRDALARSEAVVAERDAAAAAAAELLSLRDDLTARDDALAVTARHVEEAMAGLEAMQARLAEAESWREEIAAAQAELAGLRGELAMRDAALGEREATLAQLRRQAEEQSAEIERRRSRGTDGPRRDEDEIVGFADL